jgi:hypothetical protein
MFGLWSGPAVFSIISTVPIYHEPEKCREGYRDFRMRRSRLLDMNEAIAYTYPVLVQLMESEHRRLFLSEGKTLSYILQPGNLKDIQFGDFPAIESLSFAVLELENVSNTRPLQKTAKHAYQKF